MTQKSELKPEHIYAVIAVIFAFVAYQAFVVVPQEKLNAERTREISNQVSYDACTSSAAENYNAVWESECTRLSLGYNCALPTSLAKTIDETMNNEKNRCVSLYK